MNTNYFKALLSISISFLLSLQGVKAAPGDTTWVQANNISKLDHYGAFDTLVNFPNGSKTYQKILMVYTLGNYACPTGTQFCHQWDYTITNYVFTDNDSLELSRFITPYAGASTRFPATWQHNYYFDVTDYYNQLKNNATIRTFYSGYSWGFSANIRFAFIEGVPPRNVLGVSKAWGGYFYYGNPSNSIDNNVTQKTFTAPANTQFAELNLSITGHGADATSACCEFNNLDFGHDYYVMLNGAQVAQHNIWRNDCGVNEIFPQTGTWIYNRANWCPGNTVKTLIHQLPNVSAGNNYNIDLNFEPYIASPNADSVFGGYEIGSHVFYYGSFNNQTDASIEDIIAPTTNENYLRQNPSGFNPIIKVKNRGANAITSITINYGVKDSLSNTYTWTGNLLPLAEQVITLPKLATLQQMSIDSVSGNYKFRAQITSVNGSVDNDLTNNLFQSSFFVAPKWPSKFVIGLKTNNLGVGSTLNSGISETSWKITDLLGNVFAERKDCDVSTQYYDTVSFAIAGFYKFTISDTGCDGLSWWPYFGGGQVSSGVLTVRKVGSSANIPMNGYSYTGQYRHDFGCEFTQYFTVPSNITDINDLSLENVELSFEAFPNPAKDKIVVNIFSEENITGQIRMMDALGQEMLSKSVNSKTFELNTSDFSNGIYTIIFSNNLDKIVTQKLIIAK